MQHLRPRRTHPRSLARSHDHDVQHHAPTCSKPSKPAADYRDDARGDAAALGLRHGPPARLQPGPVARLPLARRLCRVRRRAVAARARRARRVVRLAPPDPASRLRRAARPSASRAAGAGVMAYAERLRRQNDLLTVVRRLSATRAAPAEAEAEIRGWLKRAVRSPNESYWRYATRVVEYNCAYAADLHNLMSPEQRGKA